MWLILLLCGSGCTSAVLHPPRLNELFEPRDRAGANGPQIWSANQTAQACVTTAVDLEQAGHLREAIALYEKARQHDPALPFVTHRLAVLYDLAGETAKAQTEFTRALKERPGDAGLLNDLGQFHAQHQNLSQAEIELRKAVAADPQEPRARINLAVVLAHQGRHQEGFEMFAEAVGPAAAHSNLGVLLAKEGQTEAAIEHFQQALALDPELRQPQAFLKHLTRPPSDPAAAPAAEPAADEATDAAAPTAAS